MDGPSPLAISQHDISHQVQSDCDPNRAPLCEMSQMTSSQVPAEMEQTTLSKRQIKRLCRREKWIAQKSARRAKEKEKKKRKLLEAREQGRVLGPSRKQLKKVIMKNSSCQVKVAIDMSLDHLMTEFEISKALKQLHRCYSLNRRAKAPLQLYITSFSNAIKAKMKATAGCMNWDINFSEEMYADVFPKKDIIYLSSESPYILESVDDTKAYIIGGLVDHNRYKGICHKLAVEKQIYHARLPIDEYLIMKTRKVLTIDQVFLILLRKTEGVSWKDAFLSVLPSRKGALPKDEVETSEDDDSSNFSFENQNTSDKISLLESCNEVCETQCRSTNDHSEDEKEAADKTYNSAFSEDVS